MKMKAQKTNLQMDEFAETTIALLKKGDVEAAKSCLKEAEDIFQTGTVAEKNEVLNVYLFSVSTFMEFHHCSIKDLIPKTLLTEYYKQVNTSGL